MKLSDLTQAEAQIIWEQAYDFLSTSNGSNFGDISNIYLDNGIVVGVDYWDCYSKDGLLGYQEWHVGRETTNIVTTGVTAENVHEL